MNGRAEAGEARGSSRVLVIDDDDSTRRSVAQLLASRGFEAVCAHCVEAALECVPRGKCSVAILDLVLPGVGGVDALCQVRRHFDPIEVVVLTGTATVDLAMDCVRGGAFDLLTKPARGAELIDCVARALMTRVMNELTGIGSNGSSVRGVQTKLFLTARAWHLSHRQREVLLGIVLGQSNKQIANHSGCAERTIEMHVSDLLRKAGVDGRSTLVAKFWLTPMG